MESIWLRWMMGNEVEEAYGAYKTNRSEILIWRREDIGMAVVKFKMVRLVRIEWNDKMFIRRIWKKPCIFLGKMVQLR